MTNRDTVNRPISHDEITVIRAALEAAATAPGHRVVGADLATLRVVGRCTCGCDSVDFATDESLGRSVVLADGIGQTPNGGTVGVLVWGTDEAVTGLEVYDLGAGEADIRLPLPASIVPWERR